MNFNKYESSYPIEVSPVANLATIIEADEMSGFMISSSHRMKEMVNDTVDLSNLKF